VDLTSANCAVRRQVGNGPDDLHVRRALSSALSPARIRRLSSMISTRIRCARRASAFADGQRTAEDTQRLGDQYCRHKLHFDTNTLVPLGAVAALACRVGKLSPKTWPPCQAARANRRLPPDLRAHSQPAHARISVLGQDLVPGERLSHRCRVAALAQQRPAS